VAIEIDQALDWRGRTVVDRDGRKIGVFDEIYLDEETNEPAWAAVKTGTLRLRRRVMPVGDAEYSDEAVRVPFTKDQVRSAPSIDSDGWVTERDQAAILRHYGIGSEQVDDSRPRDIPAGPVPGAESEAGPENEAGADAEAEPSRGQPSQTRPAEGEPQRVQLKRYTVTETVTRRSEFGAD
jgi:sporulation protein YlmC with PRC-barrel domain